VQAIEFDGKQLTHSRQRPAPALEKGSGEVLIRPTRLGVCSTDLEICRGYMDFAGVLGHEFVGVVEEAADKKNEKWIGQRVVGEINCVCGKCDLCKSGLRTHCRDRTVLGIAGRDGAFAEQFSLPAINLHAVPDGLDDDHAVFAEPVAAACQILQQLTVEGRPFITVLGDGRLGLICAQVLSQLNATVRCVGKHEAKLELCEKWGVKHRLLQDVGLREDQDIVVDCTGAASGFATACAMVRPRGTVVLKTTVAPKPENNIDLAPVVINELNIIGSRCGPFREALTQLHEGKVDVVSLISKRMKLSDGVEAIKAADQSGVVKVLIEP